MEATACFDFTAASEGELSFKKGDILKILKPGDPWHEAEYDGKTGMVPKGYISFCVPLWFQADMKKEEAEQVLLMHPEGGFIVRESQSSPGDFSISVRVKAGVRHFKVLRDGAGKYFLWIQKFNSLNSLVTYHQRSSASRSETIFLRPPEQARVRNTFIPPEVHICNYYFLMKVKAAFDFEAKEDNELSFKSGDLIMVLASSRDDWWTGMCKGKVGMFPRTYVYH